MGEHPGFDGLSEKPQGHATPRFSDLGDLPQIDHGSTRSIELFPNISSIEPLLHDQVLNAFLRHAYRRDSLEPEGFCALEREASRLGVVVEHLHCVQGVGREILVDERQLLQDVVGHRNDVAADRVGVEDVE